MIRNLKVLGLVVFAAIAASAVMASSAGAQVFGTLTTGETPSTHTSSQLTGKQFGTAAENYFTTTAGSVSINCTEASGVHYKGTSATGSQTTVTLEPTFKECISNSSLPITVATNGCAFEVTHPETIAGIETYTGQVHLRCPANQSIVIRVFLKGTLHDEATYSMLICTIKIGEQSPGGHVVFHGNSNVEVTPGIKRDDVTATMTITGIVYDEEGLCGAHHGTDGAFSNDITLTARDTSSTEHHDVWLSD